MTATELAQDGRDYLADHPPVNVEALLRDVSAATSAVHDAVRSASECSTDLVDGAEFIGATDDEFRAAHEHLAACHAIARGVAADLAGWVVGDERRGVYRAVQAIMCQITGADDLAMALETHRRWG